MSLWTTDDVLVRTGSLSFIFIAMIDPANRKTGLNYCRHHGGKDECSSKGFFAAAYSDIERKWMRGGQGSVAEGM
jgi:hypothetical protein